MPMGVQPFRGKRGSATVDTAVAKHGKTPDAALPVLRTVQEANHGCVSKELCGAIADALGVDDARVYGAASFYSLLSVQPRAGKVIRVCDGPVCMLHRAGAVRAALEAAVPSSDWAV